jgi:N-carbamoyl-L-amino-acid hydrolase
MLFVNPNAQRVDYDESLRSILSIERSRESRRCLSNWDVLTLGATPLRSLPGLAKRLSIEHLWVKDESLRSPLGSFKVLGAPIALLRLIQRRWPDQDLRAEELLAGVHAQRLKDFVVVSATDGNHGRALAAAARSVGCRCVIVLHAQVSAEREGPIAELGAQIVRIRGNYDESVHEAARLAQINEWQVVSDTSYVGYEEIPRDVMQGYSVLVDELLESTAPGEPCPFTHVVLQGGVGGLAAGVVSHFWERYGAARPTLIVVEPQQADCLMQSARTGTASRATGSVDSVMAGLACGQTSPLAWRFLRSSIDVFVTVSDDQAVQAMRQLATGDAGDVPVVSGESGAAGLAALVAVAASEEAMHRVGLDKRSRVLLLNTEGATAPGVYQTLTGRTADEVRRAQVLWLMREGIEEDALVRRVHALAKIGSTDDAGVCRIALTEADRQGRDQLVSWMRELDLEVRVDKIGNIFGVRAGRFELAPVMTGSHIDTVATGGRYDGAYGVMAGLEVVRWLNERHIHTARPLVVAAFTNEEGVRFMPDMMGSLVSVGGYPLQQALDTIGTDGARLGDELQRIGYAGDMELGAMRPHAFVELHIEQGPVLQVQGVAIGAVQDLQGISWQEIVITGQSNHAGTTPMRMRHDAGYCAASIAVFVRDLAQRYGESQVATVGAITLHPNLINVIASRATVTVDLRNTDEAALQRAEAELASFLAALAEQQGVELRAKVLARFEPVRFDELLVKRIEVAAAARGLSYRRMTSGAGHDAQMMARVCPCAMIFVPSHSGVSHNPREYTSPAELTQGANVLLDVLRSLADEPHH